MAETCQLALRRLEWLQASEKLPAEDGVEENPYCSVDPAPAAARRSVPELRLSLLDESLPLFERYRAMFALRNHGSEEAVRALGAGETSLRRDRLSPAPEPSLCPGLQCSSALFRHEIAYVLGQMQHPAAVSDLCAALESCSENPMVRHEAAEALGAIGKQECLSVLQRYQQDGERVVKESCQVALDMLEYENSQQFQYADALLRLPA